MVAGGVVSGQSTKAIARDANTSQRNVQRVMAEPETQLLITEAFRPQQQKFLDMAERAVQVVPQGFGATILHEIVTTGKHVTDKERLAFTGAALDAGARLDLRDEVLKSTPLGWACRWGREELVRLFLARGPDPIEATADSWATPLSWAEKCGHVRIAAALRSAVASR